MHHISKGHLFVTCFRPPRGLPSALQPWLSPNCTGAMKIDSDKRVIWRQYRRGQHWGPPQGFLGTLLAAQLRTGVTMIKPSIRALYTVYIASTTALTFRMSRGASDGRLLVDSTSPAGAAGISANTIRYYKARSMSQSSTSYSLCHRSPLELFEPLARYLFCQRH